MVKDSLSKCEANPFSTFHPIKQLSTPPDIQIRQVNALPQDTLEISHSGLKKEALDRLKYTSKVFIVQQGFMRVGKYLFLAVAFPPYLMIYGLPKWVIVEGLPVIFSFFVAIGDNIKQKLLPKLEFVGRIVERLVGSIQTGFNIVFQPLVRIALEVKNMTQQVGLWVLNWTNRLVNAFKTTNPKGKTLTSRTLQLFKQVAVLPFRWLKNLSENSFGFALKSLKMISNPLKASQKNFVKLLKRLNLTNLAKLVPSPFINKVQTSQQLAQKATAWISRCFTRGEAKLRALGERIHRLAIRPIERAMKSLHSGLQKKLNRVGQFFKEKRERGRQRLKRGLHSLKVDFLIPLWRRFTASSWLRWLFAPFTRLFKALFGRPFIMLGVQAATKGIKSIFSATLDSLKLSIDQLIKGVVSLFKTVKSIPASLYSILKGGWAHFASSIHFIGRCLNRGIYHVLVILIMCAILSIWGLELLGAITKELAARIRPSQSRKIKNSLD